VKPLIGTESEIAEAIEQLYGAGTTMEKIIEDIALADFNDDGKLTRLIRQHFDLTPHGIIDMLKLKRPSTAGPRPTGTSAARRRAWSSCRMTAASSPKEAMTSGASIRRALIISPMACFLVTPSYSRTAFFTESREQLCFTIRPFLPGYSFGLHER
jgi:hypothetical protein